MGDKQYYDCESYEGLEGDAFVKEMRFLLDNDCRDLQIIKDNCEKAKVWLETMNEAPIKFSKFQLIPLVEVDEYVSNKDMIEGTYNKHYIHVDPDQIARVKALFEQGNKKGV